MIVKAIIITIIIKRIINGQKIFSNKSSEAVFSLISNARFHTDISNLLITVKRDNDAAFDKKWDPLYKDLKIINGMEE